jgi:hypothetical protein
MLHLRPMTQDELDARLPALARDYAEDEVRSGRDRPETVAANFAALYESIGYTTKSVQMAKDLRR